MGQHADDAIAMAIDFESQCDSYVNGEISQWEAFEAGIIDHQGIEHPEVQAAWDRTPIGTDRELRDQLRTADLELQLATHNANSPPPLGSKLNEAAIENLKKDSPTCNICSKEMQKRTGKFGDFYFCKCPGQSTVSQAYWDRVKDSQ